MKKILKKIIAFTLVFCELFQGIGVYALTKDENVYVKLNENGEVQSTTITEHLSDYSENTINDKTSLDNIKNINGSEKYDRKGDNLIWETTGSDIYYQGTYNKDLPITLSVKYYLDGKEKKVDEMLGKKGHVKISLTYENNSYKYMNINGRSEKIYVPYAIVTTTILNNTDNKNIKVTNGEVIDNGVGSIVTAISSPGLYESLKLNELKDINRVEISYDTESFELNSIYSVATDNLFDNNIDMFSEINGIYKNIDLLQSNMDTIVDGSKKLSDGTNQMDIGITELNTKIQELTNKYRYYRNRDKNDLKEELIKIVEENIKTITPALEEEITNETSKLIKDNKKELENAVIDYTKENTKKVIEEEVDRIVPELNIDKLVEKAINSHLYDTLKNDSEITELTEMLKEDINNELENIVLKEFNEISNNLDSNMSEVRQGDIDYIVENYGLTEEQASQIVNKVQVDTLNQAKKNVRDANITDRIINELKDSNYISNLVNNYINNLNERLVKSIDRDTEISDYSNDIKEKIVSSIKKDLEDNNIDLNKDFKNYISGVVDKIIDKTAQDLSSEYTEKYANEVVENIIKKQLNEKNVDSKLRELLDNYDEDINQKVNVIDDKVKILSDSLNMLNDGSSQISNGMRTLSDGLDRYNKEGINKISNLVNGDVKTLQKRVDALIELSNENKTIDSTPLDASKSSKMIFMIDSVSKQNNTKPSKVVKETKSSIFDKIKGLFE